MKEIGDAGRSLEAYCEAVQLTALRAGLVVSGDLVSALTFAVDSDPTFESVRQSPPAMELLNFWLSPSLQTLRAEVGLSS